MSAPLDKWPCAVEINPHPICEAAHAFRVSGNLLGKRIFYERVCSSGCSTDFILSKIYYYLWESHKFSADTRDLRWGERAFKDELPNKINAVKKAEAIERFIRLHTFALVPKTPGNTLLNFTYLHDYESGRDMASLRMKVSDGSLATGQIRRLVFINGMHTSLSAAIDHAKYLSRLSGGYSVNLVYNSTSESALSDLDECVSNRFHYITKPTLLLIKEWNAFFKQAPKEGTLLQVCHSQGAIHTRNALYLYPKSLRERIEVLSIAPGAVIEPRLCRKVVQYRSEYTRDFVPTTDFLKWVEQKDQHAMTLKADKCAPCFDHSFQSPTYEGPLRNGLKAYLYYKQT